MRGWVSDWHFDGFWGWVGCVIIIMTIIIIIAITVIIIWNAVFKRFQPEDESQRHPNADPDASLHSAKRTPP